MSKGFFEKIADLINGIHNTQELPEKSKNQNVPINDRCDTYINDGQQKQVSDKNTVNRNNVPGQNGIEKKSNLINAIIGRLQANYRGEQHSMMDKILSVYILDSMFYDSILSSDFKSILESALSDELGIVFNGIEVNRGPLPSDPETSELFSEVHIGIKALQRVQTIRKAVILPVENHGSTLDSKYYLDSEEIAKLPNHRYNIGIGENPVMADSSHRVNQIAVDDNRNSNEYDKNKYVSRAHAYISFSEEFGFLLNVELGGTRAAQKRTHIQRGMEKIELNNVLIPAPLRDGDYIILSKYVHLLFKEA